jgi:hypothetical protein
MTLIKPELHEVLPTLAGKSIGILGGSGRVVRSLLTQIHLKQNTTPIKIYTNPTTALVPTIQEITGKPSFGIGVENDNIRYKRATKSNDAHLIGAHNFFEMIECAEKPMSRKPMQFDKAAYKNITDMQNALLATGDMDTLLAAFVFHTHFCEGIFLGITVDDSPAKKTAEALQIFVHAPRR